MATLEMNCKPGQFFFRFLLHFVLEKLFELLLRLVDRKLRKKTSSVTLRLVEILRCLSDEEVRTQFIKFPTRFPALETLDSSFTLQ